VGVAKRRCGCALGAEILVVNSPERQNTIAAAECLGECIPILPHIPSPLTHDGGRWERKLCGNELTTRQLGWSPGTIGSQVGPVGPRRWALEVLAL